MSTWPAPIQIILLHLHKNQRSQVSRTQIITETLAYYLWLWVTQLEDISPTLDLANSRVLITHRGRQGVSVFSLLSKIQSINVIVSIVVHWLPMNLGIEVNWLNKMLRRGTVNPLSVIISNRSLCSRLEEELNNLMPKYFSSNITFLLMIICCLTRSNNQ